MTDSKGWLRRWRRVVAAVAAYAAVAVDFHGDATQYFSYFTILTNLSIGTWFLAAAWAPRRWEAASGLRLALTVYGLVTLSVYWVLLSPTHHPQGWNFGANLVLHLFVPLAMAAEDLLAPGPRTGALVPVWTLLFPLAYCLVAVGRGLLTGWYPYFFLNQAELGGWAFLGLYVAGLLVLFLVLAYGWRLLVHSRVGKTAAK